MQCSYSPALLQAHYSPPFQNHSRPRLPHSHRSPEPKSAPSLSPRSSPSQHDRQAQLTVPVSGERKPSIEVK